MPYDPTTQAVIDSMIQTLDHDADMTSHYVDKLRQLAYTIHHILQDPATHQPTGEQDATMRASLGYLWATPDIGTIAYVEVLQRCAASVERELSRWDSSLVQPVGWLGATQVPVGGGDFELHQRS